MTTGERHLADHLVALEQLGLELQAPHVRTTRKRRVDAADLDVTTLASDSLRFVGWDPDALVAVFPGLRPDVAYELEAVAVCERGVRRVQSIRAGDLEVVAPTELTPATATVVRVAVPAVAYATGTLEVRIERTEGPDATLSELRLYGSEPAPPSLTVVGDSRGGLIGTVGAADGSGVAGVAVRVTGDAGAFELTTDPNGVFRVPLGDRLGLCAQGTITVATGDGRTASATTVHSHHVARGLRELPPLVDRLDLTGSWGFHGGPFQDGSAPTATATVPGHIIFDGLVPDDGVATFQRTFELPVDWADRAVLLRCDGAYGRAEVRVNGHLAGVHGSGATSFDVELTPFLLAGANAIAVTLTEFTPYAVLDDMSWYAHMSLLGIWRDIFLFAVPKLHLGQLDIRSDWNPATETGSLRVAIDVVDGASDPSPWDLTVTVRDGDDLIHTVERHGRAPHETIETGPLAVEAWSAEIPRLYDLEVAIGRTRGPRQAYHRRIGFRRVETRGNQLLVNGAPIRVRGVNRHDSRIRQGRALSAEDIRTDIANLRQTNVNVIRTSHYPPSPHLLEACDEMGMFVFEQPPICFSGGFDDHHWTRTNEAAALIPYLLDVTAETVARDRGHASVIVWDLGNESRWGRGFDAQLGLVREMDPSRPTIFSFDLNELGPENELIRKPAAERPDIRSYHYPGWDRTWGDDLAWLGAYDEPTVLDEFAPVFAPCLRGPGEGYGLAIDPGIRDYWGAGYQPFMAAALADHGVIGGLIWGGFGEVFAIPLDLTIGEGPWAHLPVADYVRTHDHYPVEPGVFRRGDGDWGIFDAWNRPRPERWHVHRMYAPIELASAHFDEAGTHLEVVLTNRFAHRSLAGLDVRLTGGTLPTSVDLAAGPGESSTLRIGRDGPARTVRLELWHEEGWLVDGHEWAWPGGRASIQDRVLALAHPLALDWSRPGVLAVVADGAEWLAGWPELHVLDADEPHIPVATGRTDGRQIVVTGAASARAPLASRDWEGGVTARVAGSTVVLEYDVTYRGGRPFRAKEIGLTLRPRAELRDLWWERTGEWSVYPPDHVGRRSGIAAAAPGANGALTPAPTWPEDATAAGSNDYRSAKRSIQAAGMTDGRRSLTVVSDGTQHARAELVDGAPVLHVLDWYGGVRTLEGNHPIWSAYFGFGRLIETGTRLQGRVVVAAGDRPEA